MLHDAVHVLDAKGNRVTGSKGRYPTTDIITELNTCVLFLFDHAIDWSAPPRKCRGEAIRLGDYDANLIFRRRIGTGNSQANLVSNNGRAGCAHEIIEGTVPGDSRWSVWWSRYNDMTPIICNV